MERPSNSTASSARPAPWTDVYALALVLVEVVTGRAALDGGDTTQLYIASTDPTSRPTLRGSGVAVTDAVEDVVKRALAVDPRERYMRAGVFWDALVAAMPEGSVRRESAPTKPIRAASKPEIPAGWNALPTGEYIAQDGDLPPQSMGSITSDAKRPSPDVSAAAMAPTALASSPPGAPRRAEPKAASQTTTGAVSVASTAIAVETANASASQNGLKSSSEPIPSRSSKAPWIAGALLLAGGGAAFLLIGTKPVPPPPPPIVSVAPVVSSSPPAPAVQEGPPMVRIPAGSFSMGSDDGGKTERPIHKVTISHAFDLDRTEVTAAEYERCVDAGKCSPSSIHGPKVDDDEIAKFLPLCTALDPAKKHHPINCIDQAQGAAFCKFVGKRLPTEAEWEYAARGTDGRQYPWGNEAPACGKAIVSRAPTEACARPHSTAEVATTDGKSPFGALDMAGNVWEWVADGWDPNQYAKGTQTDPSVPEAADNGVLRGGSWDFAGTAAKSTFRLAFHRAQASVSTGVRCAKTAE